MKHGFFSSQRSGRPHSGVPALSPEQIDRIRACGHVRNVKRGDILFEPGDTAVPFFVLLSGNMEIVQPSLDGERAVATHGPGEFTGEMTMISGQRCLVRGRVTEPGEFLELSAEALRSLVGEGRGTERDPDARLHPAPPGADQRTVTATWS